MKRTTELNAGVHARYGEPQFKIKGESLMIKNFKFITLLFISTFIISCTSFGENLKKSNPDLYNDIVGTWYILSSDNPGEVMYTITFNEDGTVSGDTTSLFGYKEARWIGKIYVGHSVSSVDGVATNNGWLISKGNFSVFNTNTTNIAMSEKIFYSNSKYGLSTNNINFQYLTSIPPLNIMKIEYQSTNIREKFFVFSRDLKIVNSLKVKFLKDSENILSEKKNWEKLNKQSIFEHITFLKNVTDINLKSNAETSLNELLDKKIFKYIQKNFKTYSKYSDKMIVYEDGTEVCKLYELLRNTILGKNNISGEKNSIHFNRNKEYDNGFDIVVGIDDDNLIFNFKPYKNNLVIMGLSKNYKPTPKGWEYALKIGLEIMIKYPKLESIDVDLLEKL